MARSRWMFAVRRVASGVVTLLLVTILVFTAIRLIPGSYADVTISPNAPESVKRQLEAQYGLDGSLPEQYVDWLGQVVQGNLGTTLGSGDSIRSLLGTWLPVTAQLAGLSLLLTLSIGIPLAIAAGMARSRASRQASRLVGALAMSAPNFVLGSIAIYLFSRYQLGLSVSGFVPLSEGIGPNLKSIILPAATLAVVGVALIVRTGRDAVASVLSSPHVTAARARGETTGHILRHHVLRNAAPPMVTVIAVYIGSALGGTVIIETLFTLPGMGQAALRAVGERDYPVVSAVVLLSAGFFIFVSMLADLIHGLLDPRVAAVGDRS